MNLQQLKQKIHTYITQRYRKYFANDNSFNTFFKLACKLIVQEKKPTPLIKIDLRYRTAWELIKDLIDIEDMYYFEKIISHLPTHFFNNKISKDLKNKARKKQLRIVRAIDFTGLDEYLLKNKQYYLNEFLILDNNSSDTWGFKNLIEANEFLTYCEDKD